MKTMMERIAVLRAKRVGLPAALALAAVIALAGGALAAEPYPDRPITLIVPYAAGGSSDVLARLIGERMSKSLGQQVVIDNRAGAGSRLGTELAAKSAADGYTLLLADMPHTIVPAIQKGVHYDPVQDFMPIDLIGTASMVFSSILPSRRRQFGTSSRSQKPSREKSLSPPAESAAPLTSPQNFFRPRPSSSSCMCRFAAPALP